MSTIEGLPDYYIPISNEGIEPVKPHEAVGPTITLKWLPIDKLVVDTRYQRNILKGLKSNVRQIGIRFKWRRFAPVVVCAIGDTGYYAIIDGQHRTTGAHLRGLSQVPCAIVEAATIEEQGDSFKSLNANTTKVLIFDIFKADLAANEPYAKNYNRVAKNSGIKLVPGNTSPLKLKQGECKSYKAFEAALKKYREPVIIKVGNTLAQNSTTRAIINSDTMGSLCEIFKSNPQWMENYDVDQILNKLDFSELLNKALGQYRQENSTKKAVLTRYIYNHIKQKLGEGA